MGRPMHASFVSTLFLGISLLSFQAVAFPNKNGSVCTDKSIKNYESKRLFQVVVKKQLKSPSLSIIIPSLKERVKNTHRSFSGVKISHQFKGVNLENDPFVLMLIKHEEEYSVDLPSSPPFSP